jgi:hypothetical protein
MIYFSLASTELAGASGMGKAERQRIRMALLGALITLAPTSYLSALAQPATNDTHGWNGLDKLIPATPGARMSVVDAGNQPLTIERTATGFTAKRVDPSTGHSPEASDGTHQLPKFGSICVGAQSAMHNRS